MELTERITARAAELASEAELLRKQLADTEHELERLMIAGQVITQLTAEDPQANPRPAARQPGTVRRPRPRRARLRRPQELADPHPAPPQPR